MNGERRVIYRERRELLVSTDAYSIGAPFEQGGAGDSRRPIGNSWNPLFCPRITLALGVIFWLRRWFCFALRSLLCTSSQLCNPTQPNPTQPNPTQPITI